ncbi:MAG: CDP-alcohol phosphatidyltransferase family protein [Chloroflexi bacterium]|nr:CDP-alcohol phosphatidyltransferase family protein [Chloroflexota bacterium]
MEGQHALNKEKRVAVGKSRILSGKGLTQERLSASRKTIAETLTQPVVRLLANTKVSPNDVSWLGFGMTLGAAALIASGHLLAAGLVALVASSLDMIDGALARYTRQVTQFGAVLDATLDRTSEAALFLGIIVYYLLNVQPLSGIGVILAGATMIASFLVSYVRARAEGAGLDCQVGLLTRTERVGVLVLGLALGRIGYALIIALGIIAVMSVITVTQRLLHVSRQSGKKG